MQKNKGWTGDAWRHYLARKGIRTVTPEPKHHEMEAMHESSKEYEKKCRRCGGKHATASCEKSCEKCGEKHMSMMC